MELRDRKGNISTFQMDEHPRPETNNEKLQKLKPLFQGGTVTAGNASGVNDGASALLLMSREKAEELGVTPLARYVTSATAGLGAFCDGLGPIYATQKILKRTGLALEQIGLVELNEAFAAQSIACIRELGLNEEIVNVNGGAIAFGHRIGRKWCPYPYHPYI